MSTTTWDQFLPYVLPAVRGCSDPVAQFHTRNAAIEFCQRSDYWVVELDPIPTLTGITTYDQPSSSTTVLCRILDAWWGGQRVGPRSTDELRDLYGSDWRSATPGQPSFVTQLSTDEIVIVPAPNVSGVELSILGSVAPTRAAPGIETAVFQRHAESIALGAIARILNVGAEPWTSEAGAALYYKRFRTACSEAQRDRLSGLGRGGETPLLNRFV